MGNVNVVARIPADLGKRFSCSHTQSVTVEATTCDTCDHRPAVALIKGEQDSMGWEPRYVCADCLARGEANATAHLDAADVEDRPPPPGYKFLVSEFTNYDIGSRGTWFGVFDSFREATALYRRAVRDAAPYGGLYRETGVQTVPAAEAAKRQEAVRREAEAEAAAWLDDQYDDDYDDYDIDPLNDRKGKPCHQCGEPTDSGDWSGFCSTTCEDAFGSCEGCGGPKKGGGRCFSCRQP